MVPTNWVKPTYCLDFQTFLRILKRRNLNSVIGALFVDRILNSNIPKAEMILRNGVRSGRDLIFFSEGVIVHRMEAKKEDLP